MLRLASGALATLTVLALTGPLLMPVPSADGRSGRELAHDGSRFAEIDGVEVHHELTEGGDGAPVVLLHHFYGSTRTWRRVQPALAGPRPVVSFDRPGFGLTQRPRRARRDGPNPYTRAFSARLALGLLDELDARQGVLMGASAGGTVALEAYARAPERVRALVLVSPAITGDVGPPAWTRGLLRSPQVRRIGPRVVRRLAGDIDRERVSGSWADPSRATQADVDAYARPLRMAGWDRALYEVVTADDPPDLRALLGRIDVPTLVVAGDQDPVIPPHWNARTAEAIPTARLEVLEGCGHTPHEECPDALVEAVTGFLDGL